MRATFQDRETAALMGVSIERIHTVTFAFGPASPPRRAAAVGPVFLLYRPWGILASLKRSRWSCLRRLGNFGGAAALAVLGPRHRGGAGQRLTYPPATRRVGFLMIVVGAAAAPLRPLRPRRARGMRRLALGIGLVVRPDRARLGVEPVSPAHR